MVTVVEPTALSVLLPNAFAQWLQPLDEDGEPEEQREFWMAATCDPTGHAIWLVSPASERAWPVARPRVRGNLVVDMGFVPPGSNGTYSVLWRTWVRAMFLPRMLQHVPDCDLERKARAMGAYSTVGTFELDGAVYAVEWHPGEIQVMDAVGSPVAVMRLGAHMVLERAAPGGSAAPVELLDRLRSRAIDVLGVAADDGRGPFALLPERS